MGKANRLKKQRQGKTGASSQPSASEFSVTKESVRYSTGPLPSPDVLSGFGDVDPSFPARIVAMAEKAQEQEYNIALRNQKSADEDMRLARANERMALENQKSALSGYQSGERLGVILSSTMILGFMACGVYLISIGKSPFGVAALTTSLGTGLGLTLGQFFKQRQLAGSAEEQDGKPVAPQPPP